VKVLHLIQRYPPAVGGSETWCREVCRCLTTAGDEMKVLTLDVVEEESTGEIHRSTDAPSDSGGSPDPSSATNPSLATRLS